MPELSEAMEKLQKVFDKYAGQDGDKKTLSKAELSNLLHKEFSVPKVSRKRGVVLQQKAMNGHWTFLFVCFTV